MKGKSDKAFSHNVSAEMHAGKPQKQSLAIAYAVKRKAKKMAKGGMVVKSPEAIMKEEYDLAKHEQSHGELERPDEVKSDFDPKSESSEKYRRFISNKPYEQSLAPEDSEDRAWMADGGEVEEEKKTPPPVLPGAADAEQSMRKAFHFGHGGIAKGVMKKRMMGKEPMMEDDMVHMAQGGYLEPDYDYLAENDSYPDPDQEEHDVLDYDVDAPENKVAKRKQMLKKILSK